MKSSNFNFKVASISLILTGSLLIVFDFIEWLGNIFIVTGIISTLFIRDKYQINSKKNSYASYKYLIISIVIFSVSFLLFYFIAKYV